MTGPGATNDDRAQEGSTSLWQKLSLPSILGSLALTLLGGGRDAEAVVPPDRAVPASTSNALFFPARITPKEARFDPGSHMQKIDAAFDDGLERKRLLITLPAAARSELAHHADAYLSANPPKDFDSQLKWQRHLFVLRACDPCLAAGYDRAEEQALKSFLDGLDSWQKSKTPLRELDISMRKFHQLIGALGENGQASSLSKMMEIERELGGKQADLMAYVKSSLDTSRKRGLDDRKSSQEAIQSGSKNPVLKYIMTHSVNSEIEKSPDFKSEKGRWLFQEKLADGKKAGWIVELDSMFLQLHGRYYALRLASDPNVFVSMSEEEFRGALKGGRLDAKVKEARRTAELETKHADALMAYDFPKEGKIGYLRVFPDTHDKVISATLQSSMLLSAALTHRYGERLDNMQPIFTGSPTSAITGAIDKARAGGKGPAFYCIDLYNHGSPGEVAFDHGMTARDLVAIAKRYPDCRFAFTTIACFGGGLREGLLSEFKTELEKDPDLKSRVALFTQTKPNVPNYLAAVTTGLSSHPYSSTSYYLHMVDALYDPKCKTFGEAARRADLRTKECLSIDAECVIDGQLIGRHETIARNEARL